MHEDEDGCKEEGRKEAGCQEEDRQEEVVTTSLFVLWFIRAGVMRSLGFRMEANKSTGRFLTWKVGHLVAELHPQPASPRHEQCLFLHLAAEGERYRCSVLRTCF